MTPASDASRTFEIVLVHPHERAVAHLPEFELEPVNIADADFLREAVQARLGIAATVLMRLAARRGASRRFTWYRYALRAGTGDLPAGMRWDHGAEAELVLGELERVATDQPWASPGWWPTLVAWVDEACRAAGLAPVAAVEQVRAWDLSTIAQVRLADGAGLFYKAVPRGFGAEPPLTAWLGERMPGRVPAVVARDLNHRGMLLAACSGARLDGIGTLSAWERAARAYGELQRACEDDRPRLVHLGVPHRPLAHLAAAWEQLLADEACLQPGSHADLNASELASLRAIDGARVAEWVERLGPCESVEHGDFHSGNAFVAGAEVCVIDWTDAAVTHPFLSLATFLRSIRFEPRLAEIHGASERVARAYLDAWGARDADLGLIARVGAVFQAIHHRERLLPLVHRYDEIRTGVPAYARLLLETP